MKITRKTILLYCVPQDIIPEDAMCNPSSVSVPGGLLPCVVTRHDMGNEKLPELMEWFRGHLAEDGGYIPASAALPALSLDSGLWEEAVELLRGAVAKYQTVQGPVFVPQCGGRTGRFAVADWYTRMQQGSTLSPVVTFKQVVDVEAEQECQEASYSADMQQPDNAVQDVPVENLCNRGCSR